MLQVNTTSIQKVIETLSQDIENVTSFPTIVINGYKAMSEETLNKYLFSSLCSGGTRRELVAAFRESSSLEQIVLEYNLSVDQISKLLRDSLIRFPNQKAHRILMNKKVNIKKILFEVQDYGGKDLQHERWARLILMNETYGMGFKEISDFLKWIGFSRYLAVLDSINLKFLKRSGLLEDGFLESRMLSKAKKYYELEDLENQLAESLNLTVSDLDNLILLHDSRRKEIHRE